MSDLEREIVAVSLRFGVLSRFTAYVAIDHAETVRKDGKRHRITQPVEMPEGWAEHECVSLNALCHPHVILVESDHIVEFGLPPTQTGKIVGGRAARIAAALQGVPAPPPRSSASRRVSKAEREIPDAHTLTNLPGQYEIRNLIGKGGSGSVCEAFDRNRGEPVTITLFRGSADKAEKLLARIRLLMALSHPSVPWPLDIGQCDEGAFVVTGSARQGSSLDQLLKDRRPGPAESARWVAEVAEALQYLDDHGFLCWDVNPETILVGPDGRAVLTDVWAHIVTALEALSPGLLGTPAYMPPERISAMGAPLDSRCTTYSLGIVLYELLTGICPFAGSRAQETFQKVQTMTPRSPRAIRRSVPRELEAICLKAMARKPEDRYATPGELAEALRQFLSGQTERTQSFWKRR